MMSTRPSTSVPIRDLVALATRAPSVHNSQPWRWCVAGEQLALFAHYSRQLSYTDPAGRDLVMSCGAALHHLRAAAASSGWKAHVRRMPNPYNDAQLANISFESDQPGPDAQATLDSIRSRRTDRRRAASQPVPRDRLDGLLALGPAAGVNIFAVVSQRARADLLHVLAEAEKAQRSDPRYVDEIVSWTQRHGDDGIPASSLPRLRPETESVPSRFPSGTLSDHERESRPVAPVLLAICTSSDDTASRLRAGEALSAVLLKGTADGLAMVPLSQAIEVDSTRRLLQDELLADAACPQIIVQVGWSPVTREPVPLTPRRPVDDVLGDVTALPPGLGPYLA